MLRHRANGGSSNVSKHIINLKISWALAVGTLKRALQLLFHMGPDNPCISAAEICHLICHACELVHWRWPC